MMPDERDGLPKQSGVFLRRGDAIEVTKGNGIVVEKISLVSCSHAGAWVNVELGGGSEP